LELEASKTAKLHDDCRFGFWVSTWGKCNIPYARSTGLAVLNSQHLKERESMIPKDMKKIKQHWREVRGNFYQNTLVTINKTKTKHTLRSNSSVRRNIDYGVNICICSYFAGIGCDHESFKVTLSCYSCHVRSTN
jgi:hypothetical protein